MKEHTLTIKTKELLINPIFVIVIFGKVLIHFTTAILLEKIESTLSDSHKISNAILESVEGKSLVELEQSLHQLQLSSIHQPHSEKHLTVLNNFYLL